MFASSQSSSRSTIDRRRRRLACGALVGSMLMGSLSGCRDPLRPAGAPSPLALTGYEAAVIVQPAAASGAGSPVHTLRVRWRAGDHAPPIGGFQAELLLPPGLALVGDVMDQRAADGLLLRQLRADGQRVVATGAAGEGFVMGDLFVLTVRGAIERIGETQLVFRDVVDQRGVDRLSTVRVVRESR